MDSLHPVTYEGEAIAPINEVLPTRLTRRVLTH